ncbi:uncharacterized protein G2W53_013350 [Senna tora]|uniref:Uncharacterized protein n=1 Tax=Senna tora TaxID=362788 RepID=A0A834TZ29_9FABA|nr:uncharacterized protein G2W53_013350 [Senna tora]
MEGGEYTFVMGLVVPPYGDIMTQHKAMIAQHSTTTDDPSKKQQLLIKT